MPGGQADKTKYREEYHPKAAFKACRLCGATDRKLAEIFDISTATLHVWKKTYEEFMSQMVQGKAAWKEDLAEISRKALILRIKGFRYTETTKERSTIPTYQEIDDPENPGQKMRIATGLPEMVETKKVSKRIPPDVNAIKFALKNADPENWKDLHQSEVTGKDGGPMEILEIPIRLLDPGEKSPDLDESDESS